VVQCCGRGASRFMAGTGSNSTKEAFASDALGGQGSADAGSDGGTYYNKPTQEGFYQHFRAVAEDVGIPICVYNIPGRTGKNIRAGKPSHGLAELENVALVKEATGSLDQASQVLAITNLTVLSGRRQLDPAPVGGGR